MATAPLLPPTPRTPVATLAVATSPTTSLSSCVEGQMQSFERKAVKSRLKLVQKYT